MVTLYTQKEASKMLRISERSLERKRIDGTGPKFTKIGGRVVYSEVALKEYVEKRTYSSTSQYGRL